MTKIILITVALWGISASAAVVENLDKHGVALQGYDPVSYFKSDKPQKGQSRFQAKQGEAIYWFSSESNKQEFLKEPKKYEPQYGGWCAYAVADHKSKVEVDPLSYTIQDGRLLLFYNGVWGDTRKKWLSTKNKDPKAFLKEADDHWPEVKNKAP